MGGVGTHAGGVNYRALANLFALMSKSSTDEVKYETSVSLLEIYNEEIRDLLAENVGDRKLDIKQGKHGMHVPGLTIVPVVKHEEVLELMDVGHGNRTSACTDMNEHSSRSHLMLSTYVTATNLITNQVARGKLHLIDLAGSERVAKSGATGIRMHCLLPQNCPRQFKSHNTRNAPNKMRQKNGVER